MFCHMKKPFHYSNRFKTIVNFERNKDFKNETFEFIQFFTKNTKKKSTLVNSIDSKW